MLLNAVPICFERRKAGLHLSEEARALGPPGHY